MQARRSNRAPDAATDVERCVEAYLASSAQPGLVYGVVRDGRLEVSGARGVRRLGGGATPHAAAPDASTAFRIASMTKSFTAATVLLLRDSGALRLDDEVVRYVPEVAALRPPTDDAPPVTVRALLTMTAGLPTDDPWGDRQQDLPDEDFSQLLRDGLSFAWTPGTAYEYSNTGYALLGRVITAVSGRPYSDVVTSLLLRPLGMTSTVYTADQVPAEHLAQGYRAAPDGGWEPVPFAGHGAYASMGGLFSTLSDLATWVGGFTRAYPPRSGPGDGHPLCRASRRELQQPHRALAPQVTWRSLAEPPAVRGAAYGFGLIVEHDPRLGDIVSHGGGYPGFGTHMRWHPASGVGVVVLANATYAPAGRLTGDLLDLIVTADGGPAARPAPVPRLPHGEGMTAAVATARRDVETLIDAWDDELASRLLAANVDADEPVERRRAAIERLRAELGPLTSEPAGGWSSSTAHAGWWMSGPGGRLRVEIRLSPQLPPRVQTLSLTAVPHPPADVAALAERLAAALGTPDPAWPRPWILPPAQQDEIARSLRVAAAWAGACRVVEVTAGDGTTHATFRLQGEVALVLALAWTPGSRQLTAVSLVPGEPGADR